VNQNFLRTCTNPEETQSKSITDFSNSKIIDLPVMYHYSRIELAKTNVVYTRAPVEAYVDKDGAPAYLLVKSLMNIEGTAWLKSWENNKSLCLNTMYKNNKSVIFNWLCQSVLTGAKTIKIAIAVRATAKQNDEHKIIGVEDVQVSELANLFGFNFETSMLCLNVVLDALSKLDEDGEYIINKTAYKPNVKLLKIVEQDDDDDDDPY
jgi:hypothetical protein